MGVDGDEKRSLEGIITNCEQTIRNAIPDADLGDFRALIESPQFAYVAAKVVAEMTSLVAFFTKRKEIFLELVSLLSSNKSRPDIARTIAERVGWTAGSITNAETTQSAICLLSLPEYESKSIIKKTMAEMIGLTAFDTKSTETTQMLIDQYSSDKFKQLIAAFKSEISEKIVKCVGMTARWTQNAKTTQSLIELLSSPEYMSKPNIIEIMAKRIEWVARNTGDKTTAAMLIDAYSCGQFKTLFNNYDDLIKKSVVETLGWAASFSENISIVQVMLDVYSDAKFQHFIKMCDSKIAETIVEKAGFLACWTGSVMVIQHLLSLLLLPKYKSQLTIAANIVETIEEIADVENNKSSILKLIRKVRLYVENYDVRFNMRDRIKLLNANILPTIANKYFNKFNWFEMSILYNIGLTPDKLDFEKQRQICGILKRIVEYKDVLQNTVKYSLIGTGAQGVVLLKEDLVGPPDANKRSNLGLLLRLDQFLKENAAWKFSQNIEEEYKLLKQVDDYHHGGQKNVVRAKGEPQEGIAVELEHIAGESLENIVKQRGTLTSDKVLQYSAGILSGLIEMRVAKVYHHRDVRPANVLIEKNTDRAVIIDLGISTDEPDAKPKDNRRYGGENDLQSLGQIMYKMCVGKHIFNPTIEKSTHLIPDEIKAERERIYNDPVLLETRLKEVDENIKNKEIAEIIKICLKAKGSDEDYIILRDKFKGYLTRGLKRFLR